MGNDIKPATTKRIVDDWPTRMEALERQILGLEDTDVDSKALMRAVNAIKSVADLITVEHINLALYAKSESVRLSAIRTYYELFKLLGGQPAKSAEDLSAERILKKIMEERVDPVDYPQ